MDRELLLEIGVEEMPAGWLPDLTSQLATTLRATLDAHRLKFQGTVEAFSTPRRLTAVVAELSDRQDDHEDTVNGPPVSAGRGADGQPTPAGLGFAKKYGVEFAALTEVETPKGTYLAYHRKQRGHATVDVLPAVLAQLLRTLAFPKQMHWDAQLEDGKGELLFGRPIRWLLYLYGARVVPFTISRMPGASSPRVQDVATGAVTYGHRFLATSGRAGRAIKVRTFDEYKKKLAEQFVFLSRTERHDRIVRELDAHARRLGGRVPLHSHPQAAALLEEVPDLVEYPTVVAGAFSAEFLTLPEEILITTLIRHQHFFPVVGPTGTLMPVFLAVTNTQPTGDRAIAINAERVVAARLRDARFFWDADRKVRLEGRLARLETVMFHKQLGSYRQKAERIEALARWIATDVFGQSRDVADHAALAAKLAKADLTTDMVREFTELQGVMGGIYAHEEHQLPEVWKAIYYQYLPTAVEADAPPKAEQLGAARVTWACVSLADKLDTLAGMFIAGERPTGSRDPFGLRRAAHGVIRILVDLEVLCGIVNTERLGVFVAEAMRLYGDPRAQDQIGPLCAFLLERFGHLAESRRLGRGPTRSVLAVFEQQPEQLRPLDALRRIHTVNDLQGSDDLRMLAELFKRVKNITKDVPFTGSHFDWSDLVRYATHESKEPAEQQLIARLAPNEGVLRTETAAGNYRAALTTLASVRPEVAKFFDDVLVMADDERVRTMRLQLLARLRDLIVSIADISELVAE